jgi:hypothetical protein
MRAAGRRTGSCCWSSPREAFEGFYHSPAYQDLHALRDEVSYARMVAPAGTRASSCPARRCPRWTGVLALGDADAPDLDLDPADLSSDPFYLDELAHDPLAFTSAAGARSLTAVLPQAWDELPATSGR